VAVVIEEPEQHVDDSRAEEPGAPHTAGQLPPARIMLVPFSLGEIELLPLED